MSIFGLFLGNKKMTYYTAYKSFSREAKLQIKSFIIFLERQKMIFHVFYTSTSKTSPDSH